MRIHSIVLGSALLLALMLSVPGSAETAFAIEAYGIGQVSDHYPGRYPDGSGFFGYAEAHVKTALAYYYRLRGHWPGSWRDVMSEGIVQVPIYGVNMQVIDPDDPTMDFFGDVFYDARGSMGSTGNLVVRRFDWQQDSSTYDYRTLQPGRTYQQMFNVIINEHDSKGESDISDIYRGWLVDDRQMRLFAITGMVSECLCNYKLVHGDFPPDWTTFVQSGLSPIDGNSINPLTGDRFWCDGRPGDLYYKYKTKMSFDLWPVGLDGQKPRAIFSY